MQINWWLPQAAAKLSFRSGVSTLVPASWVKLLKMRSFLFVTKIVLEGSSNRLSEEEADDVETVRHASRATLCSDLILWLLRAPPQNSELCFF